MLTLFLFPFKILEGIILVSYLNINLHIPGGQTRGRSCVTQGTLYTEGTFCLPVPTLVRTSILESPVRSCYPPMISMISHIVQRISVPSSPSNCDTKPNNYDY